MVTHSAAGEIGPGRSVLTDDFDRSDDVGALIFRAADKRKVFAHATGEAVK